MVDLAYPYDVKFDISGGTQGIGFMLASPPQQSKQIKFEEAGAPAAQRISSVDIASFSDFDPKIDTPFTMTSWVGGAGQLDFDFQDEVKYLWGANIVSHTDGKLYLAPPKTTLALSGVTGDVSGMTTYYDLATSTRYDFAWSGAELWRRDASNNTNAWSKVYTAGAAITDFRVVNGIGLICTPSLTGTTDFHTQSNVLAAATWTPTVRDHTPFSDALGKPKYTISVRSTIFAVVDNNKVFYTTDPTANTWAGPIDTGVGGNQAGRPGDTTYKFLEPRAVGDYLFTPKTDAVHSIDAVQDVIEVIWQWRDRPSEHNFRYHTSYADQFIYSVGGEVYQYDPVTGMNIPTLIGRQSSFNVREVLGLGADNRYVYALIKVDVPAFNIVNGTAIIRMYKINATRWAFECLWEETSNTNTYRYLTVMPNGAGSRLYWGCNKPSSDTELHMMDIPAVADESNQSSYATSGYIIMSISKSGFPGFIKRHLYLNAHGKCDATNKITVGYALDENPTITFLPNELTGTTMSSSFAANANSNSIYLMFSFQSAGTVTPILRSFDHHQRVRYRYLPTIALKIRIAKGIELRNRKESTRNVDELWQSLIDLRTTNSTITYSDFLGNNYTCTIDNISLMPVQHEGVGLYEEEAVIMLTRSDRGL